MKKRRTSTIIERIEIVEHADNRLDVLRQLCADGFRVISNGPYTNRKMFPKVNPDWFILTAERELTDERRQTND